MRVKDLGIALLLMFLGAYILKAEKLDVIHVDIIFVINAGVGDILIKLDAGENIGIQVGDSGEVLAKYTSIKDLKDAKINIGKKLLKKLEKRNNKVIGRYKAIEVDSNRTVAIFHILDGMEDFGVGIGDQALFQSKRTRKGLLQELASKNILFKSLEYNNNSLLFYDQVEGLDKGDLDFDILYIKRFTEEINGIAQMELKPKYEKLVIKHGRFQGMKYKEAMANATFLDVAFFLEYMNEFSDVYIGSHRGIVDEFSRFIDDRKSFQQIPDTMSKKIANWLIIAENERMAPESIVRSFQYYDNNILNHQYDFLLKRWEYWKEIGDMEKAVAGLSYWKSVFPTNSMMQFHVFLSSVQSDWKIKDKK